MKSFAMLGAVCAIGLSALASQAQADIYHFTQTGTVASGLDTQGLFGSAGADLTGRAYSVTFTFDPGLLDFAETNEPLAQTRLYIGDKGIAEITVDGVSYAYTVGGLNQFTFSKVRIDPGITGGWSYGLGTALAGSGGSVSLALISAANFSGSIDLTALFDYTLTDADRAFIGTESNTWEGDGFKFAFRPDANALTSEPGTLAGVPEPASWALMIVGFAGMGVTLRSRRRGVLAG